MRCDIVFMLLNYSCIYYYFMISIANVYLVENTRIWSSSFGLKVTTAIYHFFFYYFYMHVLILTFMYYKLKTIIILNFCQIKVYFISV